MYKIVTTGKFKKDLLLLNIPLIKEIILKSVVSRFSRTLSILLKSGIPMINAITYSAGVLNNSVVEKAMQVVKNDVTSGSNLSAPIQRMGLFPKMVLLKNNNEFRYLFIGTHCLYKTLYHL